LFRPFCEILVPLLKENIRLQLEGGAEIVMIFDTAAGEISPLVYRDHVVPWLSELVRTYPKKLGYYAKGVTAGHLVEPVFHDPALWAGMGFDHRWDLAAVFGSYQAGFVQGNFDQAMLFMKPAEFERQLLRYLEPLAKLAPEERAGWVSGLGHGVLPATPEENVRRMVKLIREVLS
jgi:uroporphyrinogen decarboxylase